ncbi:MAG: exo-alpha-sialidase [Opitutales bacterium]|nr:exo-alpha-sialidase [Opitutales bacterium]
MKSNTPHYLKLFPAARTRLHLVLSLTFLGPALATASLDDFLGPAFFHTTELWSGETGGRSIVTTFNGDVLVIKGGASSEYKRSTDGGMSWTTGTASGAARFSNAVLDESNGNIILVNASSHVKSTGTNNGNSWSGTTSHDPVRDRLGFRPTSYSSMQAGITLRYGQYAGRLVMPTRVQGVGGNDIEFRGYNYSSAIYSDDGGQTWQTSHPFPVFGTGEAAIVELRDGRLLYNSREHMSNGNRYIATSYDGGVTWVEPYRDPVLPDGPRGTSYGNMGGLIRLPLDDHDILLYSNLDTDRGEPPSSGLGGTRTRERENITVWVSFDGGDTWPLKRSVFAGPAAYSNLGVGRKGTVSEGRIFLNYDGGPEARNTAAQIAVFNLTWLLDGADINDFLDLNGGGLLMDSFGHR